MTLSELIKKLKSLEKVRAGLPVWLQLGPDESPVVAVRALPVGSRAGTKCVKGGHPFEERILVCGRKAS
jgi:hypothetical protein